MRFVLLWYPPPRPCLDTREEGASGVGDGVLERCDTGSCPVNCIFSCVMSMSLRISYKISILSAMVPTTSLISNCMLSYVKVRFVGSIEFKRECKSQLLCIILVSQSFKLVGLLTSLIPFSIAFCRFTMILCNAGVIWTGTYTCNRVFRVLHDTSSIELVDMSSDVSSFILGRI